MDVYGIRTIRPKSSHTWFACVCFLCVRTLHLGSCILKTVRTAGLTVGSHQTSSNLKSLCRMFEFCVVNGIMFF